MYLLYTDQGHRLCRHRLLDWNGGHGLDENHTPLLQRQRAWQRAGQGASALWGLGGGKAVPWAGARDQTQVLQGEVEDGGAGAVEVASLLGAARRVGRGVNSGSGSVEAKAGGRNLLGWGGSGAC